MMEISRIFRKKNPLFFSIEKVFAQVKQGQGNNLLLNDISLPFFTKGFLSIFRNLRFISRLPVKDVYHITGDVHYAVLALPAQKTILTIHDCVFLYSSQGIKRYILKWLLLDMPVKRSAVVTTISAFTKQEILRFTNCAADKVIVIPNPVNSTIRFGKREFNTAKPVIFFIGTTPNKNLERVVPALKDISCHLLILGKITGAQEQLLARDKIEFSVISNISEEELADVYIKTDIVLFPSTFEGFGLPILEAQKAGRVVITSNIDPMKTVAGDGAVLTNPFSVQDIRKSIQLVMADEAIRNSAIEAGFVNVQGYHADQVAAAYTALYKKIANQNKTSGQFV